MGTSYLDDASFKNLEVLLPRRGRQRSTNLPDSIAPAATNEDEIETVLHLYQGALSTRKSSLVNELRRLASLYEAHPQLLKVPYAPQWSRPSLLHVPRQLRGRANKMERAPLSFWTNSGGRTYFQNAFAALVPFDWTLRFLISIMGDEQEVDEKCRLLLDSLIRYYLRKVERGNCQSIWTMGVPHSLSLLKPKQIGFLAGADGPKWFRDDGPLVAHTSEELDWLETFVEVVAVLVAKFPKAAEAAQLEEADPIMLIEQLSKLDLI